MQALVARSAFICKKGGVQQRRWLVADAFDQAEVPPEQRGKPVFAGMKQMVGVRRRDWLGVGIVGRSMRKDRSPEEESPPVNEHPTNFLERPIEQINMVERGG